MHIKLTTGVSQDYRSVIGAFDRALLEKLSPPFPPVKLLRFDGSKQGDTVSMELNFILFRQRWTSLIVEDGINEEEAYFIDEGVQLPFFLIYWRHHHRVVKEGARARVVDDIQFKTPFRLMDYLMYPILWLQFVYRKPIYKKVFGN